MEPYNVYSQPGRRPSRFNSRIVLAVLVAVLAAAVAAAGLAFANQRSATVGTGVVVIETNLAYQGAQAAGTGMVLTSSGEVLTNNHVIRGATTIKIVVPGTGQSYNAEVVGYDASDDVAVLQAGDAANLKTISLGDSSSVDTGESVQAVGNAGGTGRFTSASGTVTAVNRSITVSDDQGGSESLQRTDPDQRSRQTRRFGRAAVQRLRPGDRHGHRRVHRQRHRADGKRGVCDTDRHGAVDRRADRGRQRLGDRPRR